MSTRSSFETLRERLRERVTEPRSDYDHGECLNCNAQLTQADVENDHTCTNCGSGMDADDEDLAEAFDWYNANGLFDEEFSDHVDDTPDRLWEYGEQ